jgi:Holliday junction resolvase
MPTDRGQIEGLADDMARLIQTVLTDIGSVADPAEVTRQVSGLDRGLPAEDEFSVICAWLGQCRLIHKLDQQQAPVSSRETYQVPDLLAAFKAAGPFLIEVKVKQDRTLSFRPDYFRRLTAYAELLRLPLLIAWKFHSMWSLFDARHLRVAQTNFNITHSEAMKQNLLGVLAGDVAYSLGAGAGVHFDCAKEELIGVQAEGDDFTEQWLMRISDVFFTDGAGRRRDNLHAETKQLFAGWDLQRREGISANSIRLSFVPSENQTQFAHGALVQLLAWERPTGTLQNWRHLLRAPTITRSIGDFAQALDRALHEGVVYHILHQQPVDWPDFLPRSADGRRRDDVGGRP